MNVFYLQITDGSACLCEGVWSRGPVVSHVKDTDVNFKLQIPVNFKSVYKERWTLSLGSMKYDTIVVINDTTKDAVLTYRGRDYEISGRGFVKVPTKMNITERFMTYCRESGLYTMVEIEREYLRLFAIDTEAVTMAENLVHRRK